MEVAELIEFLHPEARVDVRRLAVEYVVGLTGNSEQFEFFLSNVPLFEALVKLMTNAACQANVYKALINLSTHEAFVRLMVDKHVIVTCLDAISDQKFENPDDPCKLLANLTRDTGGTKWFLQTSLHRLPVLVDIACKGKNFNPKGEFHHLALVFYNITQLSEGREALMGEGCPLQRLVSFTRHATETGRIGAMGAIRNCCFDHEKHDLLLSRPVDVLPSLLLPLAGPEEFDEEDLNGMCDDLQYLPPSKERDPSHIVRTLALEALLQLCALRSKRELLRARKVYPILREYHTWEKDEMMREHCEKVVQVLIADEDPTADNLKEYSGVIQPSS